MIGTGGERNGTEAQSTSSRARERGKKQVSLGKFHSARPRRRSGRICGRPVPPDPIKGEAVIEAAKQDPVQFGRIAERMDRTGNVHGAFKDVATTVMRNKLAKMAEESKAETERLSAGMPDNQKAALSTEMMRERGELLRLATDIAERLPKPKEFAALHKGYIHANLFTNCRKAHKWLGQFLDIIEGRND